MPIIVLLIKKGAVFELNTYYKIENKKILSLMAGLFN
jgi:hypothetical protein